MWKEHKATATAVGGSWVMCGVKNTLSILYLSAFPVLRSTQQRPKQHPTVINDM